MQPSVSHSRPAVFLDRDGTLIEERCYLKSPDQVQLLPGAAEAIARLRAVGFVCIAASNQSGVGRGFFSDRDVHVVHEELLRQLAAAGTTLDAIYYCPIAPSQDDPLVVEHFDRKPGPGMLLRAAREWGLNLPQSWMIGDKLADIQAGRNAGCRGGLLVTTGHDVKPFLHQLRPQDRLVKDVMEAAEFILNQQDKFAA